MLTMAIGIKKDSKAVGQGELNKKGLIFSHFFKCHLDGGERKSRCKNITYK